MPYINVYFRSPLPQNCGLSESRLKRMLIQFIEFKVMPRNLECKFVYFCADWDHVTELMSYDDVPRRYVASFTVTPMTSEEEVPPDHMLYTTYLHHFHQTNDTAQPTEVTGNIWFSPDSQINPLTGCFLPLAQL